MKKLAKSLLCLIMALMLVFACAACSDSDKDDDTDKKEEVKETKKESNGPDLDGAEAAVADIVEDPDYIAEIIGLGEIEDESTRDFVNEILDFIEIDVTDSELLDDETAEVTVEISYPDFENMDVSEEDMMAVIEDLGYTEDDFYDMSEEELTELIMEATLAVMEDAAGDAPTVSVEETVEVNYEDGEWVVAE